MLLRSLTNRTSRRWKRGRCSPAWVRLWSPRSRTRCTSEYGARSGTAAALCVAAGVACYALTAPRLPYSQEEALQRQNEKDRGRGCCSCGSAWPSRSLRCRAQRARCGGYRRSCVGGDMRAVGGILGGDGSAAWLGGSEQFRSFHCEQKKTVRGRRCLLRAHPPRRSVCELALTCRVRGAERVELQRAHSGAKVCELRKDSREAAAGTT